MIHSRYSVTGFIDVQCRNQPVGITFVEKNTYSKNEAGARAEQKNHFQQQCPANPL